MLAGWCPGGGDDVQWRDSSIWTGTLTKTKGRYEGGCIMLYGRVSSQTRSI